MLTVSGPPELNVRNDPDQQFKYTANCRILQEQVYLPGCKYRYAVRGFTDPRKTAPQTHEKAPGRVSLPQTVGKKNI
jgi:hypothetical protein